MKGFKRETPACFESEEQYLGWLEQEFITGGGKHRLPICADCTLEYATRMRSDGRCERPEMVFDRNGNPMYDAGTSGMRGVSWHKGMKKWIARKAFGKVQLHLGYFDSRVDAFNAWEEATMRGPAYYGIANGTVTEEAQRSGLLVRDNGTLSKDGESGLPKGPVWVLRHSGSEGVRSVSCSNHQSRKHERTRKEDN